MAEASKCDRAPKGWWCSRDKGHEGPCAARRLGAVYSEGLEFGTKPGPTGKAAKAHGTEVPSWYAKEQCGIPLSDAEEALRKVALSQSFEPSGPRTGVLDAVQPGLYATDDGELLVLMHWAEGDEEAPKVWINLEGTKGFTPQHVRRMRRSKV